MAFNENTRVKIPAILHLCRLGYSYLSLSKSNRDESTNIFTDIFAESILRINPEIEPGEVKKTFENVCLALDNEDLGQAFSNMLNATSGIKLIIKCQTTILRNKLICSNCPQRPMEQKLHTPWAMFHTLKVVWE